jgi:hypothetical protein
MSAHQRQRVLQLPMSRRGEWVPAAEVAEAGGLQYGARLYELRHEQNYQIESRTERVRTGARSHIKRSWFKLLTEREAMAHRLANGEKVTHEEIERLQRDEAQATLFGDIAPTQRDEN